VILKVRYVFVFSTLTLLHSIKDHKTAEADLQYERGTPGSCSMI
jgi:hypothetical protein